MIDRLPLNMRNKIAVELSPIAGLNASNPNDYARAMSRYDGACRAWHAIADLISDAHKAVSA